jgi:hypothetical protein
LFVFLAKVCLEMESNVSNIRLYLDGEGVHPRSVAQCPVSLGNGLDPGFLAALARWLKQLGPESKYLVKEVSYYPRPELIPRFSISITFPYEFWHESKSTVTVTAGVVPDEQETACLLSKVQNSSHDFPLLDWDEAMVMLLPLQQWRMDRYGVFTYGDDKLWSVSPDGNGSDILPGVDQPPHRGEVKLQAIDSPIWDCTIWSPVPPQSGRPMPSNFMEDSILVKDVGVAIPRESNTSDTNVSVEGMNVDIEDFGLRVSPTLSWDMWGLVRPNIGYYRRSTSGNRPEDPLDQYLTLLHKGNMLPWKRTRVDDAPIHDRRSGMHRESSESSDRTTAGRQPKDDPVETDRQRKSKRERSGEREGDAPLSNGGESHEISTVRSSENPQDAEHRKTQLLTDTEQGAILALAVLEDDTESVRREPAPRIQLDGQHQHERENKTRKGVSHQCDDLYTRWGKRVEERWVTSNQKEDASFTGYRSGDAMPPQSSSDEDTDDGEDEMDDPPPLEEDGSEDNSPYSDLARRYWEEINGKRPPPGKSVTDEVFRIMRAEMNDRAFVARELDYGSGSRFLGNCRP